MREYGINAWIFTILSLAFLTVFIIVSQAIGSTWHMRRRTGFTLIELLVVIGIIALLTAILFPVFLRAREKGRQATCMNNQRQFAVATTLWAQDHNEFLPDAFEYWNELEAHVSRKLYACPTQPDNAVNGYVFNAMLSKMPLAMFTHPEDTMVTADGYGNQNGKPGVAANAAYLSSDIERRHNRQFIAAFLDGHIEIRTKAPQLFMLPSMDRTVVWLSAEDGVEYAPGTHEVIGWQDLSGKKFDAVPYDADNPPIYEANVSSLGGQPAIRFRSPSGNPTLMATGDVSSGWQGGEGMVFIVFHPLGANDQYEYSVFDQSNGATQQGTRLRQLVNAAPRMVPALAAGGNGNGNNGNGNGNGGGDGSNGGGNGNGNNGNGNGNGGGDGSNGGGNGNGNNGNGNGNGGGNDDGGGNTDGNNGNGNGGGNGTDGNSTGNNDAPPTISLTATPDTISPGQYVTLRWVSDATSVSTSNFGATLPSGSKVVYPTATSTYSITVKLRGKESTANAQVTMQSGSVERYGGALSWFRKNATAAYPPSGISFNTPTLWTVASSFTAYQAYRNGVAWAPYAGGPEWNKPSRIFIGGSINGSSNSRAFDGYVAEVIVYNKVLRTEERKAVEQYLISKYGIE